MLLLLPSRVPHKNHPVSDSHRNAVGHEDGQALPLAELWDGEVLVQDEGPILHTRLCGEVAVRGVCQEHTQASSSLVDDLVSEVGGYRSKCVNVVGAHVAAVRTAGKKGMSEGGREGGREGGASL